MKLEIIIPTYNHPSYIKKIVSFYENLFSNYDFIVSIHDSSDNNQTERLIGNTSNVKYYRYPSTMHVDEKTILALKKCSAEYGFLVGDGWIINIPALFEQKYFDQNKDLILLYSNNIPLYKNYFESNIKVKKIYHNKNEFAKDNFWYLIMYGSSIVKKEFLQSIHTEDCMRLFANKNFIYPCSIIYTDIQTMLVDAMPVLLPNLEKKAPMWLTKREGIEIWTKNFYLSMEHLKGIIDESSIETIIQSTGIRTTYLSFRGLVAFRYHKNLTMKIFWKNKKFISKTSSVNLFVVFLLCCIPRFVFVIAHVLKSKKIKDR